MTATARSAFSRDFVDGDGAALGGGAIGGEDGAQGTEVVGAGGERFAVGLDSLHQRCHRSDESIWNPPGRKRGGEPFARLAVRLVFERVDAAGRIVVEETESAGDDPFCAEEADASV